MLFELIDLNSTQQMGI